MKSSSTISLLLLTETRNALDSNFAVAEFSFELPTALLFRGGAPPRGFRTPVDVHWSEQAIMLCKVSRTSQ